jgi:hypothetical protein
MNLVTCPKFEPVMSKEATLDTMRRCIEVGARFLVNKPIDANTIHNIWQHLDIKNLGMDNIVHLLQGSNQCRLLIFLLH